MKQTDRRLIIGVIIIGAFISSLNQTVMTASLPRIMSEFGISAGVGQWLTTGYLLFMGVTIPCTGYLMEHYSPKRLYLISVSLFLAGCGAAAFAGNIYVLLLARVIQALGAGILLPLPQVVAFRLYEPEHRGTIMGVVGLTTGFAPAFGPTFAGWVVDRFGWRAIFYIMCVLAVAALVLAAVKLPSERLEGKGKLDVLSVVLSTIGFCGLLTGVTNQGNYGLASPLTYIPFAAGVVCVILFAVRQLKLKEPLLELRVFERRNFTFGTLLLVFAYGSMLSVSTLLPVYIQTLRGCPATVSGLVMLPGALFLAFLNPVTGKILDRRGPFLLSVFGLLCLGGATLGLSFLGEATPLPLITLIYAVRMLGIVALLQPLQTWAVNSIEAKYVAHGTALMNTVRQVGGAIVSAIFVTVMSSTARGGGDLKGIQTSFLATAAVVFLCLVVVAVLMRPKKSQTESQTKLQAESQARQDNGPGTRVIAIGRSYGSGGREVGARVAEALGVPLYDGELIALESKESGLSSDYVAAHEEGAPEGSLLAQMARNYGAYEGWLYEAGELSALDKIFAAQSRVIQEAAQRGPCVIVGRCADYLLRGACLSVFIRADWESREKRITEAYGVAPGRAEAEAKRRDDGRARHYRRYTGQDWGSPAHYHMVLDSGALGIDGCAAIIVQAAGFCGS